MPSELEKNPRRVLMLSGLFALIGVVSLVVVLFQAPANEQKTFSDVFPGADSSEEVLAAKHEVLDELSASAEVGSQAPPSVEEKLEILESLRAQ